MMQFKAVSRIIIPNKLKGDAIMKVLVTYFSQSGNTEKIARAICEEAAKAGNFVDENMFSEEGEYPVSAVCMEDTLTCGFTRSQFEELVLNNPTVGLQVIKTLSERISWLTTRVGDLAVTNIEERLYKVLCNVAKEHGEKRPQGVMIQFPLTHEDLSFLIGTHRVTVTRAMKALKETGKIILQNRRLILPSLAAS